MSTSRSTSSSDSTPVSSFGSYEEVIADEELKSFESEIEMCSQSLVRDMATREGSVSIEKYVKALSDANNAGVKILKDFEGDFKSNKYILDLVHDYLANQNAVDGFCSQLQVMIHKAKKRHVSVITAMKNLSEADDDSEFDKTLQELNEMWNEDVFGREFGEAFKSFREKQFKLLNGLRGRMKSLDRKMKQSALWRKIFVVVLGCSALAIFILTCLQACSVGPMLIDTGGNVATRLRDFWKTCEQGYDDQKRILISMEKMAFVPVEDAREMGEAVNALERKMKAMKVDGGAVDLAELRDCMDRIGKLGQSLDKKIEDLDRVVAGALGNVLEDRKKVLEMLNDSMASSG